MQCLLDLLHGDISGPPPEDIELETALALAKQEHVLPWAASRLRARQRELSPAIEKLLEAVERDAAVVAFCRNAELKSVLRSFHPSSLRVILLKGPSLAERIYGDTALRVSRDLDLLVSKPDLPQAESILAATGFVPDVYQDDYHRRWYRGDTTIELHYHVDNPRAFNFDVSSAIEQATRADFQGQPCWHLAPADELIYLCLHAVRHRFERLSLIVDLQLAFSETMRNTDTWKPRPQLIGLMNLVILGSAMVKRLQPNSNFPFSVEMTGVPSRHIEKLADRLWHRLLTQPREPMDWHAAHSFFLEIEAPGWPRLYRRYRHLQILAGRIIEPDYRYAARFGLHKPWQVRSLRPVRLLSQFLRRVSHGVYPTR